MYIFDNYSHEYKTRRIFELWIKSCYKDWKNGEDNPNNSMALIIKWLRTQGNYERFHGAKRNSRKKKEDICLSIATMINKKGVRKPQSSKQVQLKIEHTEQMFQSVHDWATHTSQGIQEDDPSNFHAAVEKRCQFYFNLLDIFSDCASVRS